MLFLFMSASSITLALDQQKLIFRLLEYSWEGIAGWGDPRSAVPAEIPLFSVLSGGDAGSCVPGFKGEGWAQH